MTDKPHYRVPFMSEISAIPWNGFNAVSSFSGCGGSSLGYKMAGFKVLWASEFIPAAQETYRANHPGTILDTRDIRQVQPEDILKAIGMQAGQIDLMDGSPPCASFSTAGKREEGWGKVKAYSDTKQRTDDLFFEFARLLRGVRAQGLRRRERQRPHQGQGKGILSRDPQGTQSLRLPRPVPGPRRAMAWRSAIAPAHNLHRRARGPEP